MSLLIGKPAITLGYRQWLYIAVVTLAVLPIVLILNFLPQVETIFVRKFILPRWESRFGFVHGTARLRTLDGEMFAIAEVSVDGVFARAGIVAGDIPIGYHHGFESGFYRDLAQLDSGKPITLAVINSQTGLRRTLVVKPAGPPSNKAAAADAVPFAVSRVVSCPRLAPAT